MLAFIIIISYFLPDQGGQKKYAGRAIVLIGQAGMLPHGQIYLPPAGGRSVVCYADRLLCTRINRGGLTLPRLLPLYTSLYVFVLSN